MKANTKNFAFKNAEYKAFQENDLVVYLFAAPIFVFFMVPLIVWACRYAFDFWRLIFLWF